MRPRQPEPPTDNQISSILTFDPDNMKMSDVQNIASNADNLIRIIQNIKDQVGGQQPEAQAQIPTAFVE